MSLTHQEARDRLDYIGEAAGEYAGIPMPIDGERLVIHPSYRFAPICNKTQPPDDYTVINSWRSQRLNAHVVIMQEKDGRRTHLKLEEDILARVLRTFGLNGVWSLEAEAKAQMKLAELIPHHQFRGYLLTGCFIESSPRSNICYVFRRLRPTIALSKNCVPAKVLASLCLHPIGYYDESFAGSMVPTDEVIAHLILMRGDEHAFWKWSNQHRELFL